MECLLRRSTTRAVAMVATVAMVAIVAMVAMVAICLLGGSRSSLGLRRTNRELIIICTLPYMIE